MSTQQGLRFSVALALICLVSPIASAGEARFDAPLDKQPELQSIYAQTHDLSEFLKKDDRGIVLVFTGAYCPVAQQYVPTLKNLHEEFRPQGYPFLAIYSNQGLELARMAKHAHESDLPFPSLKDPGHKLADLVKAQVTPEVVVLDRQFKTVYRGAINDQFTKRGRRRQPTQQYLKDALTQLVKGLNVERTFMAASGCLIERHAPPKPKKGLTFYKDVLTIMQKRCQACHRPGEVGPFSLLTYDDVYYRSTTIKSVINERRMPPWHGEINRKYGKFANDVRLPRAEIDTINDWIRTGAEEGNPDDAPPAIQWPDPKAWKIGKPDFVYKMTKPFQVPKTGILDYQFYRVPLNFKEDRWIQAIELKPGNPEVVHHITLHLVKSSNKKFEGFAGMAELYGLNAEQAKLINAYVPGDPYSAKIYPNGQAVRIPRGCDLVFELHYTPNNREATTDQSMLAIRWAKTAPENEVFTHVFRKPIGRFRIPAGAYHHKLVDSYYFQHDVELDAVLAHFHLRGKSYRLELIQRDDESDEVLSRNTLFSIPVWDPDWQRTYELAKPVFIPAGTELRATAHFDNSRLNPNNPDPSRPVVWGQQMEDEMFSSRFMVRRVKEKK